MKTGVYSISNLVNNRMYIGSARNITNRKAAHFRTLRKLIHKNPILQRAFNKYGEKAFRFDIIEECSNTISEKELQRRETVYIWLFKTMSYQWGYNILNPNRTDLTERHYEILLDANKKAQEVCKKTVYQYTKKGDFINGYESINKAVKSLFPELSEEKITKSRKGSLIGNVCNKKYGRKTAFGYKWSFKKEVESE